MKLTKENLLTIHEALQNHKSSLIDIASNALFQSIRTVAIEERAKVFEAITKIEKELRKIQNDCPS